MGTVPNQQQGDFSTMLKITNGQICEKAGKPLNLKGFNLGGWLLMEGFLLGGRNIPQHQFFKILFDKFGKKQTELILEKFWANFINKNDIENITSLGLNCVRLPFHYKIFTEYPNNIALKYFYGIIKSCQKNRIYCILDMHAAPGSQNADWHSDSAGKSLFWEKRKHRESALKIWEMLAEKFKGADFIAGFNILNEPVTDKISTAADYYNLAIKRVSSIDPNRLIFLDGLVWSTDFTIIKKIRNLKNVVISPHFYNPVDYVFNFTPKIKYPGKIGGEYWDKKKLRAILRNYAKTAADTGCPVFIGEFGLNTSRNNAEWVFDTVRLFEEFGFGWAYWPYKSVYNHQFPSGLYQYIPNDPWIKREGPLFGWENYAKLNNIELARLFDSWKTKNYKLNTPLLESL